MSVSRRAVLASTACATLGLAQSTDRIDSATVRSSDAVTEWIRRTAIPLSTPVAGHGFDDMKPLKKVVGDARIVALGEASHGTREFFQLKHRMLEFLVTQMGFSVFSLEASMPECYRVNKFVLEGEGDAVKLMSGPLALWNTKEVLDVVLWMREYNKSGKGRVEFAGFDMQNPTLALQIIRDFVAKADPEYASALAHAAKMVLALNPRAVDPAIAAEWEKVVKRLESLRQHEGSEWATQNARVVLQFVRYATTFSTMPRSMAIRDASMAENIKWILDRTKHSKIVVSAHNLHVMTGPSSPKPGPDDSMGAVLRKTYGDELVTFGCCFGQGSFLARSMNGGLETFTVGPLDAGTLDATLRASGIPLFALDLRGAPKTGGVADRLRAEHSTRNIMSGFVKDAPGYTIFDHAIAKRYDCLLFVDKTAAAQPNPKPA